ncbi:MAG: hypothetical protein MJE77_16100 [Proteobacteria bacterium]|nr:hypothetical protein [Pseudomonadota bacterium]
MMRTTVVQSTSDHVRQWIALKRTYVAERGSDTGRFGKAIPRTTHGDVRQLTDYWHGEYSREVVRSPRALDRDRASRRHWVNSKRRIDAQLLNANPGTPYPHNEWFWQDATSKLALYLDSRKAVPSRTQLIVESVRETVSDHIDATADRASEAIDQAGNRLMAALKTGAWIVGGLIVSAIAIPRMVRAFKD